MKTTKRILLTFLLTIGSAQPALAMEQPQAETDDRWARDLLRSQIIHAEHIDKNEFELYGLLMEGAKFDSVFKGLLIDIALDSRILNDVLVENVCKKMIKRGVDISSRPVLHTCIERKRDLKMYKMLIDAGANVNLKDIFGHTPLMAAAKSKKNAEVCSFLINAGADINAGDNYKGTALMKAIEKPNICTVLINAGADINAQDINGETALMKAAAEGSKEVCSLLIGSGADLNLQDHKKRTAIRHVETELGRGKCYWMLIVAGAHDNLQPFYDAINGAAHTDPILKKMIDEEKHTWDETGFYRRRTLRELLIQASKKGNLEYCKLLIRAGADINYQSELQGTALICGVKHPEVCALLLANNADIRLQDHMSRTALAKAAQVNATTCQVIITRAIFNPVIAQSQLNASQAKILSVLCIFKHLNLPKDIQFLILGIDQELREQLLCCPIKRNCQIPNLTQMPISVIRTLIQSNKLDPDIAATTIKDQNVEYLKPLMEDALTCAQTADIKAILNPNLLDANFGAEIEQNIRRRLGLVQIEEPKIETYNEN